MLCKTIKYGLIAAGITTVAGVFVFGDDLLSYARTSVHQVRQTAKDNVPIEFELARAKDLIDQVVPELRANVTLIAQEEVQIENLQQEIATSEKSLADQRTRLARLRDMMGTSQTRFVINGQPYSRTVVRDDLSRTFDRLKEAEVVLAGKKRLLETRQQNLNAAIAMLENTRHKKMMLEDRVAGLEGQYHLVKAAGSEGQPNFDSTKIAQAEKLIGQIKNRLDVAERVLSHQAKFVERIPLDEPIDEADLITQVDEFLIGETAPVQVAPADDVEAAELLVHRDVD